MKKDLARVAAREAGHETYVPEKPCRRGHSLRSIHGTCIECRRMQEKTRYQANPEKTKEKVAAKYHKNAEKLKEKRRASYKANAEKEKAIARVRSAEWRKNNPSHAGAKEAKKQWKKNNPAKVRADTVKRRTALMNRVPKWLGEDDLWMIEQAYDLAAMRSKMFGFKWHVDHVLPLQGKFVSGLHVATNLQVLPWIENVSKANKYVPA
jgi:hypothetical protein